MVFQSQVQFEQLIEKPVASAGLTLTVINVLNVERIKFANTGAVTVTNFTDGQNGQEIILLGDGNTTVQHNTHIKTSTAANVLLAANRIYQFVQFDQVWYGGVV